VNPAAVFTVLLSTIVNSVSLRPFFFTLAVNPVAAFTSAFILPCSGHVPFTKSVVFGLSPPIR